MDLKGNSTSMACVYVVSSWKNSAFVFKFKSGIVAF